MGLHRLLDAFLRWLRTAKKAGNVVKMVRCLPIPAVTAHHVGEEDQLMLIREISVLFPDTHLTLNLRGVCLHVFCLQVERAFPPKGSRGFAPFFAERRARPCRPSQRPGSTKLQKLLLFNS